VVDILISKEVYEGGERGAEECRKFVKRSLGCEASANSGLLLSEGPMT
jgi:hypothetical protein